MKRVSLGDVAVGRIEGLGPALGVQEHLRGAPLARLALRSGEQSPADAVPAYPPVDRHPFELPLPAAEVPQAAGRDHAGVIDAHDLHRLPIEVVHLLLGINPLLVDEDADAQVHRGLDLAGVTGRAHRDGEAAVGAQVSDFLVSCWNASMNSIGNGKTIVVFWLTPISSSVCR